MEMGEVSFLSKQDNCDKTHLVTTSDILMHCYQPTDRQPEHIKVGRPSAMTSHVLQ